ncbi:5-formyltetrahydrofolate cyclo-ligase [Nautilia sp.]
MNNAEMKIKSEFRKICLNAGSFNRYYYSKKIGWKLYEVCKPYKNILFFIPLRNEPDIHWVLKRLRKEKKNIFVPFMEDLSFKMVKYQLPLVKKIFSIFEPVNKQKTFTKVDLAVVPVVGIDLCFRRVGFGKGMYDRFFENLGYRPEIVFVQLKTCFSNRRLTQRHDVKADGYISFNIYKRRKNDGFNNFSRYDIIRSRGIFYSEKNGYGKVRNLCGTGEG